MKTTNCLNLKKILFSKTGHFTSSGSIVFAVSLIFLIGSLLVVAMGTGSLGVLKHWWSASHFTAQIPLNTTIAIMTTGTTVAITTLLITIALCLGRKSHVSRQNKMPKESLIIENNIQKKPEDPLINTNISLIEKEPLKPIHLNYTPKKRDIYVKSGVININIEINDELENPIENIEEFSKEILDNPELKIKIRYYTNNISEIGSGEGLDNTYISNLFKGLINNQKKYIFKSVVTSGLVIPDLANKPLTEEAKTHYHNLGVILMFCHINKYSIGLFFDEILFQVSLSFKEDVLIKKDYSVIDSIDMHQLYKKCAKQIYKTSKDLETILMMIDVLRKKELKQKESEGQVNDFLNLLAIDEGSLNDRIMQFFQETFDPYIKPMYYIAIGMHALCEKKRILWKQFNNLNSCVFSTNLQGILDRQKIVSHLKPHGQVKHTPELLECVSWVKLWIEDKNTTEEEIKDFLSFSTGQSSLPDENVSKADIYFYYYDNQPPNSGFVLAATCSRIVKLPVFSKDNYTSFIKRLQSSIELSKKQIQQKAGDFHYW